MNLALKTTRIVAGLLVASAVARAQSAATPLSWPAQPRQQREPAAVTAPLGEDRGLAGATEALRRLRSTARVLMIVAHPDDEDGALLTYLSRGMGAHVALLTLTRGEGGQNAMSADNYDALGLIRTEELLLAGKYYGVEQLWGTEADFGFSKTQEEAFARWGHERVLYDAVLAIRRERPQIVLATFVGGVSDGHGQHQVSGEIAQEAFKAAADPKIFPEQLKDGITPWQPLAVYSMCPFAAIKDGKIFDYATGKWAPARFKNYVTGAVTEGALTADASEEVGDYDIALGRSAAQMAREGWGLQRSQNGGGNPSLSGPSTTRYHLWAADPSAQIHTTSNAHTLFDNDKVRIATNWQGLADADMAPRWREELIAIDNSLASVAAWLNAESPIQSAHRLAAAYRQVRELRSKLLASSLPAASKERILFAIDGKLADFNDAFANLLGLDLEAFTAQAEKSNGPAGHASADEMPATVAPGQDLLVKVHLAQGTHESRISRIWLSSQSGSPWKSEPGNVIDPATTAADALFRVHVSEDAEATGAYFTRPSIEQPYYDLRHEEWRLRSSSPAPLTAWIEYSFDGVPIRLGRVVEHLERVNGLGGIAEPLVVAPRINLRMLTQSRILPLDGSALKLRVQVEGHGKNNGTLRLDLPQEWRSEPASATFALSDTSPGTTLEFAITAAKNSTGDAQIAAVAQVDGTTYKSSGERIGYAGLQPQYLYKEAKITTRAVDVKLAQGLKVAYVMGTGDTLPAAINELGLQAHMLTDAELATADLSQWNVIVAGIRAYQARPALAHAEARLEAFVQQGGTYIVQYQSANFPAPQPIHMAQTPERVVDESTPVHLLAPASKVLSWPNKITTADFNGWVEERGHGFPESWDAAYEAPTETADAGQDAQRGGLLVTHPGKGSYIYVAFALHRQLPELVPGSYRLLANLLSATSTTE